MPTITPAGSEDRADATAFAGRAARWDPSRPVRLVQDGPQVAMWADTPFEVLATRQVRGTVRPSTVTVAAGELLSGLAVSAAAEVELGADQPLLWRARMPADQQWIELDEVPAQRVADLVRSGTEAARGDGVLVASHGRSGRATGISPALLDSPVLVVSGADMKVTVRLRVLFALSAMGFAGEGPDEVVRVRAGTSWLRVDGRFGAVVHRRLGALPLLV